MISVIVPIFNVGKYLQKCIESILTQIYKDIELILIDDGSTDICYEICEEYKRKDPRIRVIHKENEGLVRARKEGLRLASGEYIAYVDGDDWIEPDMLQKLCDIIERENTDIVMCGRYEDTGNVSRKVFQGIEEGRYDKSALLKDVYPRMIVNEGFFEWGLFPGLWDKLFKKECLEPFQMLVDEDLTMGEDAACTYPCLLNVNSIYVLHNCLYHYRQTPSSMVRETIDFQIERNRFNLLYKTVDQILNNYRDIFDLREQWRDYLLFLMVPRADTLYEGIESLDFLFPYPKVKKGSKIIIYGVGMYGQRLYRYLQTTNFCEVVALVDRNYIELQKQGFPVVSPERISDFVYDDIVIANSFSKTRYSIYRELTQKYPNSRINVMDEELIKCSETLQAFRLTG